jgi:hypothetical protein
MTAAGNIELQSRGLRASGKGIRCRLNRLADAAQLVSADGSLPGEGAVPARMIGWSRIADPMRDDGSGRSSWH